MRAISDRSGGEYSLRPTEQERTRHTNQLGLESPPQKYHVFERSWNHCLEYGKVPMTSLAFNFKNSANENDSVRLLFASTGYHEMFIPNVGALGFSVTMVASQITVSDSVSFSRIFCLKAIDMPGANRE